MPDYRRILITGAAGSLGSHLRAGLAPLADRCASSTSRRWARPRRTRRSCICDLADKAAALAADPRLRRDRALRRPPARAELRGDRRRHPARRLPRLRGRAPLHGCRRVVYASSIHAVGFTPVEAVPDTRVMHRPDTFYGLTKTFVEDLASLYWDKFGIESVMPAHLLLLPRAGGPADALVLAQLRRLRAAGRGGADRAARRLLGDLRHLRQRRARRSRTPTPATSASAPRTAPTATPRRSAPARAAPDPRSIAARVVGGGFAAAPHPDDAD